MTRRTVALLVLLVAVGGCDDDSTSVSEPSAQPLSSASTAAPVPPPDAAAITAVGVGLHHACALRRDGTVWCWGSEAPIYGADHDDKPGLALQPVPVPGLPRARDLYVKRQNNCIVDEEGQLYCWGTGHGVAPVPNLTEVRDVAMGSDPCAITPTGVTCWDDRHPDDQYLVLGRRDLVGIDAEVDRVCALTDDGKVYCWKHSRHPQRLEPIGTIGDATSLAVATHEACVTHASGSVSCWRHGRSNAVPKRVEAVTGAVQVAVGNSHACARTVEGAVACWGSERATRTPIEPDAGRRVAGIAAAWDIDADQDATCAASPMGAVCWGRALGARLGPSRRSWRYEPARLPQSDDIVALELGNRATCGLTRAGTVRCWGEMPPPEHAEGVASLHMAADVLYTLQADGRLLRSAPNGDARAKKIGDGDILDVTENGLALAALATGDLVAWDPRGDGDAVPIVGVRDAMKLAAKPCGHLCSEVVALIKDGRLVRLTVALPKLRDAAPGVETIAQDVRDFAWTANAGCAVDEGGRVACWRDDGQLERVEGAPPATTIAKSLGGVCITSRDGRVFCWGRSTLDLYGSLGSGSGVAPTSPTRVGNLDEAQRVHMSEFHTCVLHRGGGVTCWGLDDVGQAGNPQPAHSATPIVVLE